MTQAFLFKSDIHLIAVGFEILTLLCTFCVTFLNLLIFQCKHHLINQSVMLYLNHFIDLFFLFDCPKVSFVFVYFFQSIVH